VSRFRRESSTPEPSTLDLKLNLNLRFSLSPLTSQSQPAEKQLAPKHWLLAGFPGANVIQCCSAAVLQSKWGKTSEAEGRMENDELRMKR
jgi:hypothetical protein